MIPRILLSILVVTAIKATSPPKATSSINNNNGEQEADGSDSSMTDAEEQSSANIEFWTGKNYPSPQLNPRLCNNFQPSNLCDPDNVLTEAWREEVRLKIETEEQKLKAKKILFTNDATDCKPNSGVRILVVLAKKIRSSDENDINDHDLVQFGNDLEETYGLSSAKCQNYVMLIGIEQARLAYFKTGLHLKLPSDVTTRVFDQYSPLFDNKNYNKGLTQIVADIGKLLEDPFKPTTPRSRPTTSTTAKRTTTTRRTTPATTTTEATTRSAVTTTELTTTEPTTTTPPPTSPPTTTTRTTTTATMVVTRPSSFRTRSQQPITWRVTTETEPIQTTVGLGIAVANSEDNVEPIAVEKEEKQYGSRPNDPQHVELKNGEFGPGNFIKQLAVPWWLWLVVLCIIIMSALSCVVCLAGQRRRRKHATNALQLQSVSTSTPVIQDEMNISTQTIFSTSTASTMTDTPEKLKMNRKLNISAPNGASINGGIKIHPAQDAKPTKVFGTDEGRNSEQITTPIPKKHKHTSRKRSEHKPNGVVANGSTATGATLNKAPADDDTTSLTSDEGNARPTTPTKVAARVHIDAAQLATDAVNSRNSRNNNNNNVIVTTTSHNNNNNNNNNGAILPNGKKPPLVPPKLHHLIINNNNNRDSIIVEADDNRIEAPTTPTKIAVRIEGGGSMRSESEFSF